MKIKNAFVIEVDFDGDIYSEAEGFHVFAGDNMLQETREVLKTALHDMSEHIAEKGWEPTVTIGISDYPVMQVLTNTDLLDEIIYSGGFAQGNWEVNIKYAEE